MRGRRRVAAVVAVVALSGCDAAHNVFGPDGSQAHRISRIGWFMFIAAGVVALIFYGALVFALVAGGRERRHRVSEQAWIVAGGIVLPAVVIVALTVATLNVLNDRVPADSVRVEVIGHQFWWEARYAEPRFTTANELRIPVGQDVVVTLRSADVIHSFWVPDLAGKIDMVPGHTNRLVLHASKPGTYRGQCAEFCGIQHAFMIFTVTAVPRAEYAAWTEDMAAPAATPTGGDAQRGEAAFTRLPCGSCHTVRGTPAAGTEGPDLTHFASRTSLGAGAAANNKGNLAAWIADPDYFKPGALMPDVPMSDRDFQAVLAYVESLK